MQTFAVLMASMGVVVAFVYHFLSWPSNLTVCTLVLLLCVVVVILWYNLRQFNWKNEPDSE